MQTLPFQGSSFEAIFASGCWSTSIDRTVILRDAALHEEVGYGLVVVPHETSS
jgi:hypothetical protein